MLRQILGVISLVSIYFAFFPSPVEVKPYLHYRPPADFTSYIKPNRFADIKITSFPQLASPEDLQLDIETGDILTGNTNGAIFKITPGGDKQIFLQGKGPILRIQLDKKHNKIHFLDIATGICQADLKTKQIETLVNSSSFGALNSFDIAQDGKIYFTETTSRFRFSESILSFLSGNPDGNVFVYDPKTNSTKKIIENLYFPNGIEVSPNQKYIYISQMGRYRVFRYNLQNGSIENVIEDLQGIPDNLRFNKKGQLWIGLPLFRDQFHEYLIQNTWVRKLLVKLSPSLLNKFMMSSYSGAIKINEKGQILDYMKQDSSKFGFLSTALQFEDRLYLGSFGKPTIGVIPLKPSSIKDRNTEQQL